MRDYAYFDNAATTRVSEDIAEVLRRYNALNYYNPSANYLPAQAIRSEINDVRAEMLRLIKGFDGNLVFTSSGTEADNMALFGSKKRKESNIVISASEHPAVFNSANALKNNGFDVRICPVDSFGVVDLEAFASLVDANTALVSVMHVNNLTGGKNDIAKLVSIAKKINPRVLFHSDGVQALGKVPINLTELGVDLYTVSGHKIGAPKGVAALYMAKGVSLSPILYGGGQEAGLRSSTENVGGILAFGAAMRRALDELPVFAEKCCEFRDIIREKLSTVEGIRYLSDDSCAPNIFTFAMKGLRGEVMQHELSSAGFLVGTGSACSARRADTRLHKALGIGEEYASGIIRISFGRENTAAETEGLGNEIVRVYHQMKRYMR
ncbi:MAG: cysteine desulfurase [Clostridia bacterium]|nr:cysteine desulfurase [Clostridia bacterium]